MTPEKITIVSFIVPGFSAFMGALCAYTFMIILSKREESQKKKNIKDLLMIDREVIPLKIASIEEGQDLLAKKRLFIDKAIMPSSVNDINRLKIEVLGKFKFDEKRALDAVCHWLKTIDDNIAHIDELTKKSREEWQLLIKKDKDIERCFKNSSYTDELLGYYEKSVENLKIIHWMIDKYLEGKYSEIVSPGDKDAIIDLYSTGV